MNPIIHNCHNDSYSLKFIQAIGMHQWNEVEMLMQGYKTPSIKNLKNTAHVGATEFKAINWLPTKNRVDQHTCVNIMKFFKGMAPAYADEIFQAVDQSRVTRTSKLNLPFRKSSVGQKCLSYMGPKCGMAYLLI